MKAEAKKMKDETRREMTMDITFMWWNGESTTEDKENENLLHLQRVFARMAKIAACVGDF